MVTTLRRVLSYYVGTHDFRAFAGAIERTERDTGMAICTIRTVYAVDLVLEDDTNSQHYRIDFIIQGALYKQIRNMVGTAVDVCRGALSEDEFVQLLHQDSTKLSRIHNRSRPAPPQGLTLENVYFDDPDF
jgi:tRNA pseudouridine38-40 synthase